VKDQDKITAIAERVGWEKFRPDVMIHQWGGNKIQEESHIDAETLTRYLTSYDAILSVLTTMTEEEWVLFDNQRFLLTKLTMGRKQTYAEEHYELSPTQLADCFLKATGLWKE